LDHANRDHLALHGISADEAEQAILDPYAVLLEIQIDEGEERTKALGMTAAGRILTVLFAFRRGAIPYPATASVQGLYLGRRQT
jgi:uncharacterized DUF497 family protein